MDRVSSNLILLPLHIPDFEERQKPFFPVPLCPQIFLPTLEENMIDKGKFVCMLNWSHVAAAVFKAVFGYIGFLTFKEDTQEEVVNNLSPGLKTVVNLILVVKALLSYPLPYYAACDLVEKELFRVREKSNIFVTKSSCKHLLVE